KGCRMPLPMRRLSLAFVFAACAFACAGGAVRAIDAPAKLTVSWGTLEPTNTPVWIANDAGIFKKHGLDVDLHFVASSLQITALLSGDVQIAMVGGPEVVSANASGADLVI